MVAEAECLTWCGPKAVTEHYAHVWGTLAVQSLREILPPEPPSLLGRPQSGPQSPLSDATRGGLVKSGVVRVAHRAQR